MIDGSCHCGNIRFNLDWPGDDAEIVARRCGCSFCVKHGGIWTSNRRSTLTANVSDSSRISKYRFGMKTADFIVCNDCGVVPMVLSEIDGRLYAVVNVNTFNKPGKPTVSTTSTNFDGEDTGSRLERRQRNWIPNVRFDESAAG